MEAGLMDILRSGNKSWIYDTYFSLYRIGWSEIGSKNFFLQFLLPRYVKRCQYTSKTLCKNFKIFEIFFDLPFQLFILQYYAVLEDIWTAWHLVKVVILKIS